MGNGHSWGSHFLTAEQAAFGTPANPTVLLPVIQESVKGKTPRTPSPSVYGKRNVAKQYQGIKDVGGAFEMELLPLLIGLPLKWLNGKYADISGGALPAPSSVSVTAASGGTNADGARKYKVANVFQRTLDSKKMIGNPSDEVSVTFGTGDNTGTLTWTNATPPTGWTVVDSIIYATAIAGLTNTEKYLAKKGSTSTGYSDTGSVSLSSTIVPIAPMYRHIFKLAAPVSGVNPLLFFTILKNLDNGQAQKLWDCMMGKATFTGSNNGSDPCKISFDLLGCDFLEGSEVVPTIPTALQPAMRWQAALGIDGTVSTRLEAFSVVVDNKIGYPDGTAAGSNKHRTITPNGRRTVNGSITLDASSNAEWVKMRQGTAFSLDLLMDASPGTPLAATTDYDPWPMGLELTLGSCYYPEAGGNINGDGRMTQPLPFEVEADSNGDDIVITLYNTNAASVYADAS